MADTAESKAFIQKKQQQLFMNAVTTVPVGVAAALTTVMAETYFQQGELAAPLISALVNIAGWLTMALVAAGAVCMLA